MKKVKFETSLGSFTVELNEEKAPLTCENFLRYVKEGFASRRTSQRRRPMIR